MFSCWQINFKWSVSCLIGIRRKSKRWQRDKIVCGILCTSVVAIMKITCAGGSSRVFSKALNALVESMWTSSIIKILYLPEDGINITLSRRSRIASTPLLEAPSISITSTLLPLDIATQFSHVLHGVKSTAFKQRKLFAKIRAEDVFPVPRSPVNKSACGSLSLRRAFKSVCEI